MDNVFIEQVVKKNDIQAQQIKKIAMIGGAVILNVVVFLIFPVLLTISLVASFCAFYFLWCTFEKTYEYAYTDGSIDIDVVYGKSQRRHLITADAKEFQFIAPIDDRAHAAKILAKYDKMIDATSGDVSDHTYVGLISRGGRTCKVIFEPDDRIVEQLARYIPGKFTQKM